MNVLPLRMGVMGSSDRLEHLHQQHTKGCQRCRLHWNRNQLVFGTGNPEAEVMLVGEAPGEDENKEGEPFIGPAGKLLDGFIGRAGLNRAEVYILNLVKCWPEGNRDPDSDEIAACAPFLHMQIRIVRPKVIIAIGRIAAASLSEMPISTPLKKLREMDLLYVNNTTGMRVPVVATYHPSYILRNLTSNREEAKTASKLVRDDFQRALRFTSHPSRSRE